MNEGRNRLRRSFAVLLVLAVAGAGAGFPQGTPSARELYLEGKKRLETGDLLGALDRLESAVAMKPDAERYRETLERTRDLVLDQIVSKARQSGPREFHQVIQLHELCKRVRAADPRTTQVTGVLESLRRSIEELLTEALAFAAQGDIAGARKLLGPAEQAPNWFPRLSSVRKEIDYLEHVVEGRRELERGNAEAACAKAAQAKSVKSLGEEAEDLLVRSSAQVLRLAQQSTASLAQESSSTRLAELLGDLDYLADRCPRAFDGEPLREQVAEKFRSVFEGLWSAYESPSTENVRWARCELFLEARRFLSPARAAELDSLCASVSSAGAPRVGLAVAGSSSCLPPSFKGRLLTALPEGFRVIDLSADLAGRTAQAADLSIVLRIESCDFVPPSTIKSELISSTYVAGQDEVSNPEYYTALERAQRQEREVARLQALQQANPSDTGLGWQIVAAQIGLGSARRALAKVKPFELVPRLAPYQLERAAIAAGYLVAGTVEIRDLAGLDLSSSLPFEVVESEDGEAIRGAHPTDQSGFSNREPVLPSESSLASRTQEKTAEVGLKHVRSLVPRFLAAAAQEQIELGQPGEALRYLAILRRFRVLEGDPELAALKSDHLRSLLLPPADVQALSSRLAVFSSQFESVAESAAAVQSSSAPIESALESIVLVSSRDQVGTGFIASADGLVVTNHHVVEGAGASVEIELANGDAYLARIVAVDPDADLALLKVASRFPRYLRLATSQDARIGQDVYALGSPRGLAGTVTKGIVSARRRLAGVQFIQLDASVNPGNSGGPLILPDGRVIGVVTFKIRDAEGLNFAVSVDEVLTRFSAHLRR